MKTDRFSNLHSIILRETSTKKFDVALQSVFQAEARQNIAAKKAAIKSWRQKIYSMGCCVTISTQDTQTYSGSQDDVRSICCRDFRERSKFLSAHCVPALRSWSQTDYQLIYAKIGKTFFAEGKALFPSWTLNFYVDIKNSISRKSLEC